MPLRIFMTTDTAGGVWVHALELSRGLAARGVRVRLLALGQATPAQRAEAAAVPGLELLIRDTRLEWMAEPWRDLDQLAADLPELAAGCDVVHLNHLVHGHLDWGRPVLCAVHSCVLSWFESVRGATAPEEWREYRQRVTRSLQAADLVAAPSRWMLGAAQRHYGPFRASAAVANGSSAPWGDPHADRAGLLAAGRVWDEAKNLGPLAARAGELPAPLRIAGPAVSPDGQRLTLAGGRCEPLPQPVLWRAMQGAALFLAPARYEPFGLGVLEAARSGCPLLLGDIGSLRENWDGAAVFVDPGVPDRWPAAVSALLEDPPRRLALAEEAQRRARRLDRGRMAEDYAALYEGLTAGATRGRATATG